MIQIIPHPFSFSFERKETFYMSIIYSGSRTCVMAIDQSFYVLRKSGFPKKKVVSKVLRRLISKAWSLIADATGFFT